MAQGLNFRPSGSQPASKRRKTDSGDLTPSAMARIDNIQKYQIVLDDERDVPLFEIERDVVGRGSPEVIPVQLMCPAFERFCHVNHLSAKLPPPEYVKTAIEVRTCCS